MIIRSYKTENPKENPHKVDVRPLYNDPSAQVSHITLQPGESLKPHKTPVDVVFYILEGTPTVLVGEEREAIGPDHLVESPAHIVHCLSNEGSGQARILVIKAPRPAMATRVL
jgi:mannose-6-phosphate isomerase-like protein (cupin superfamily)